MQLTDHELAVLGITIPEAPYMEQMRLVLREHLCSLESPMVEALQRLLFSECRIDARRQDIADFLGGLFSVGVTAIVQEVPPVTQPAVPTVAATPEARTPAEEHALDHLSRSAGTLLTGRKPALLILPDGTRLPNTSWRKIAEGCITWIAQHAPLPALPYRVRRQGKTYFLNVSADHEDHPMINSATIRWMGAEVFLDVHQSAENLISGVCKLANDLAIDPSGFRVSLAPPANDGAVSAISSLPQRIAEVMREMGVPSHFNRIAEEVAKRTEGRKSSIQTIRATLGVYSDLFVGVGNGLYGLKEWGLTPRSKGREGDPIGDLILKVLEERDEPMVTGDIIRKVQAIKDCRETSVRGCLKRDERFQAFPGDRYGLKRWVA
jgi:hypothetical protein